MQSTAAAPSPSQVMATPDSSSALSNSLAGLESELVIGNGMPLVYARQMVENHGALSMESLKSRQNQADLAAFANVRVVLDDLYRPNCEGSAAAALKAAWCQDHIKSLLEMPDFHATGTVGDGFIHKSVLIIPMPTDPATRLLQQAEDDCCTTVCPCTIQ